MDASQRGRLMLKLADLVDRDTNYLAMLETYNNGKPLTDALGEMYYCAQILRYYAGWCDKIHGSTIPVGEIFFFPQGISYIIIIITYLREIVSRIRWEIYVHDKKGTCWSCGSNHSVELSCDDAHLEMGSCTCLWLHDCHETSRTNSFDCFVHGIPCQRSWISSRGY